MVYGMAKQIQGILGGFVGRLGSVIGYRRGQTWCMRTMPLHVANPRTPAQMEHRHAFREQVRLAARMAWPLAMCLTDEARRQHMTCRNLFVRMNQRCFAWEGGDEGYLRVDYPRLQLSTGRVAPVAVKEVSLEDGGVLEVRFDRNPLHMRCAAYDEVHLYAYSPSLEQGYLFNPVYRHTGRLCVLLPEWLAASDLQFYLMATDRRGGWSSTAHGTIADGDTSELENFSYLCRHEEMHHIVVDAVHQRVVPCTERRRLGLEARGEDRGDLP